VPLSTDSSTPRIPEAEEGEAERFWEDRYRDYTGPWAVRPNPLLAEVAGALIPGTALDIGCGTGGDAIWLAREGWRVTAVDISATAVGRVAAHARDLGLGDRVVGEPHDLARTFPDGGFDLVSAQYFHTPFALPRASVLRSAAQALRAGGLLLVVDHGSIAPWSWNQDPDTHFPTPTEVFAELDLDPRRWQVERSDTPRREATGPGGQNRVSSQTAEHERAGAHGACHGDDEGQRGEARGESATEGACLQCDQLDVHRGPDDQEHQTGHQRHGRQRGRDERVCLAARRATGTEAHLQPGSTIPAIPATGTAATGEAGSSRRSAVAGTNAASAPERSTPRTRNGGACRQTATNTVAPVRTAGAT
jgi:SAM-dependent methyltransferase